MNTITLLGRMVKRAELKITPTGKTVATFTVACQRNKENADFFDCVAWGRTGEFIEGYFDRGQLIFITGELTTRTYDDKEGNKRKVHEIVVNRADFAGGREKQEKAKNEEITFDFSDKDLPF